MMARLAAFVALALVAGAATVPVSTRQLRLRQGYVGQAAAAPAAPAIDPKEMAVVEKIRAQDSRAGEEGGGRPRPSRTP